MPTKVDTLYYPFYKGVQMIEVDHLGYWDRKIHYLEQSNPRAVPHSMRNPPPLGNEFFFRDTTGKIVKAYNTLIDLDTLTERFSHIPHDRQHTGILSLFPYHRNKDITQNGVWVYSPQSMFLFNGYSKVSNQQAWAPKQPSGILYGLIDTFGNIKVPIEYEEILPIHDNLLVKQNNKWGIITKQQKIIVPIDYDYAKNYYSEPENNRFLYFLKGDKYVAIYHVATTKLYQIGTYDNIYDTYLSKGYLLVVQNGLVGLLHTNGKIALPVVYSRINGRLYKKGRRYYAKAIKDGKEVEVRVKWGVESG